MKYSFIECACRVSSEDRCASRNIDHGLHFEIALSRSPQQTGLAGFPHNHAVNPDNGKPSANKILHRAWL
jgi:hypothetical protein